MDETKSRVLAVTVAEHVDTSFHLVGWQVERYGFNSELVVDGSFGEDSDHVAVLDEFEQNVDLVELDAYVELSGPGREIMVKSIASLKSFGEIR